VWEHFGKIKIEESESEDEERGMNTVDVDPAREPLPWLGCELY
jgi:hypothetical protein